MQLFVAPQKHDMSAQMLETELMILRRRFERDISDNIIKKPDWTQEFYPCTLSSRTIVYKGMLTPEQASY
jgi:glutamate synthase (ferredoxin)